MSLDTQSDDDVEMEECAEVRMLECGLCRAPTGEDKLYTQLRFQAGENEDGELRVYVDLLTAISRWMQPCPAE